MYSIINTTNALIIWFSLVLLLSACTPAVSTVRYDNTSASKPKGCELDVYGQAERITTATKTIGDIRVGDTGFSVGCDAVSDQNI
jgi:hypothetical protein